MENNKQEKKKSGGIAAGVAVCLLLVLILLGSSRLFAGEQKASEPAAGTVPPAPTETTGPKELSVTDLLKAVITLKDELETSVEDMVSGNTDLARQKVNSLPQKTQTIRMSLDLSVEALGDSMPSITSQLTNIRGILDLVDTLVERILHPMVRELEMHPVSQMKAENGLDTRPLRAYVDFLEDRMPDIEALIDQSRDVDLSIVDSDGDMEKYLAKSAQLLELYRQDPSVFDSVKSLLGEDGDRLYVLAAQNSAEIRASGGFPGAVGTLQIRDGILTLGDFKKVYDVFSSYTPAEAKISTEEIRLFHGGLSAPRDADFCPDFERVAYIWALGYEAGMKEPVDGVISVTPAVLQRLLKVLDEEIVLFDGMVLNGDNAVKSLQHDLYFTYFSREYVSNAGIVADQLFADAAKKTGQKLMENMEAEDLMGYLGVIKESLDDRTVMLWSKDETLQNVIEQLGWSGGLNKDPQKPQLGVYFNCTVASKMGWFLIADIALGEGVRNEDGSCTYDVLVTLSNDMSKEELQSAGTYITGGNSGGIGGSAYFFAPAGGTVSNFTVSTGSTIYMDEYHDLQLGFLRSFNIFPGKNVEVSFQVTTAPGVDAPLTISQTPTVQDYH